MYKTTENYIHIVESDDSIHYYSSKDKAVRAYHERIEFLVKRCGFEVVDIDEDNGTVLYGSITELKRPSGQLMTVKVHNDLVI